MNRNKKILVLYILVIYDFLFIFYYIPLCKLLKGGISLLMVDLGCNFSF